MGRENAALCDDPIEAVRLAAPINVIDLEAYVPVSVGNAIRVALPQFPHR